MIKRIQQRQEQADSRKPKTGSAMPIKQKMLTKQKKKFFSVDCKNCLFAEMFFKIVSLNYCLFCSEKKAYENGLNLQNSSTPRCECEQCQTDFSVGDEDMRKT